MKETQETQETQDLYSTRLCDKVAEASLVKIGVIDDSVNLAAAKAMRQHYDDAAIVSGLEQYAQNEVAKMKGNNAR